MLQLDPTTQASLEAATTPNARAAAIVSSLSGTITVTVRDGTGATKGSGTMASFGTLSANVIVLSDVTTFTVSETGTPDPATWTIEFANAGGRYVKGTFGLYTSPVAEFKWSLATWENGQSGTIASAYCTVRKNEVLSDATDTFNVVPAPTNVAPIWLSNRPTSFTGTAGTVFQLAQYAYDPDSTSLTYTISSFIPPGYSINSSTGALTIGTTSQTITVRVSDGVLYADWSIPVTVASLNPIIAGTTFEETWATDGYNINTSTVLATTLGSGAATIRGSASSSTLPLILSTPTYGGNRAMRCGYPAMTTTTSSPYRSEIAWFNVGGSSGYGTSIATTVEGRELFIGFALRLGTPEYQFPTSMPSGFWSVLHQMYTYPDTSLWTSPLNPLIAFQLRMRGTPEVLRYQIMQRINGLSLSDVTLNTDPLDDLNTWTTWQFHYKFASTATGFIRVYRNGVQLFGETGNRSLENIATVAAGTRYLPQIKNGQYETWRQYAGYTVPAQYSMWDSMRFATPETGGTLASVDPRNY